jgi:hypothetical protein
MQRKLVLAYLLAWNVVAGQQYSFVRFTIENGLSNNVVYATQCKAGEKFDHNHKRLGLVSKKKISGHLVMAFTT